MKLIGVILTMSLLIGCATSSNISSNGGEGISVDGEVEGIIRVDYKGCKTLIEVKGEKGESVMLYPANLDASFRSEGLKIVFTYIPSRVVLPVECSFASQTVAIDNVRKK